MTATVRGLRTFVLAAAFAAAGAAPVHATGADATWTARGMVEPRIEATLSSQIAATIAKLPVDRGSRVSKGDLLVAFDCAVEQARLKAAEADLEAARARLSSLRRLDQMGSVGRMDVAVAAAEQNRAAAIVEERRTTIRYCTVTAPYDGVVIDVPVHANDSVPAGTPLVSMLDDRSLRLVILAPSDWTAWLQPGQALTFKVDETGETLPAKVSHLGARIDASSQTIAVFATIDRGKSTARPPPSPLIAGMTGTAMLTGPEPGVAAR